jgi:hypothetical protein
VCNAFSYVDEPVADRELKYIGSQLKCHVVGCR